MRAWGCVGVFETVKTETGSRKQHAAPELRIGPVLGRHAALETIDEDLAPGPAVCHPANRYVGSKKIRVLSQRCRSCYLDGPSFDVVLMAVEAMTETTERECWNGRSAK